MTIYSRIEQVKLARKKRTVKKGEVSKEVNKNALYLRT